MSRSRMVTLCHILFFGRGVETATFVGSSWYEFQFLKIQSTDFLLAKSPSALNPFVWILKLRLQRSFNICCKPSLGCWLTKASRIQWSSRAIVGGWSNMRCFAKGGEHDTCWCSLVCLNPCWPLAIGPDVCGKNAAHGEEVHPIKLDARLEVFLETDEEEDPAHLLSVLRPLFDTYLEERIIEALGPGSRWLSPKALYQRSSCHQNIFYGDNTW